MALIRKKLAEIPEDAVILTEQDAYRYQTKILHTWKNKTDTFAYCYGTYLLAGTGFLTGVFLNNYWRTKFFLFRYGQAASYLPVCVLPAIFTGLTHTEFVLRDIVLQNREKCPICLQSRASAFQSFFGCVFPAILAPLSTLALAHSYATYDVPYITQEPRKVLRLVKKTISPIGNLLFAIFIGQALLASAITYMENESVSTVNQKLYELEVSLENR